LNKKENHEGFTKKTVNNFDELMEHWYEGANITNTVEHQVQLILVKLITN